MKSFFNKICRRKRKEKKNVHPTTFSSGCLTDDSGNILKFDGKAYALEKSIIVKANSGLLID